MNQYFIKNDKLKSNLKLNNVSINNVNFSFYTDSGLFNKKGLDLGTSILLKNFIIDNKKTFLDLGCGCGIVGIYLSLINENNKVDMVDVNENAVKISNKNLLLNNIKNASCFLSDSFNNISNMYDAILLNPPIHAGKKVIYKMISESKKYLNNNGELWIVIRKDHGAKSLINDFENKYNIELIKKDHGFYVLKFS